MLDFDEEQIESIARKVGRRLLKEENFLKQLEETLQIEPLGSYEDSSSSSGGSSLSSSSSERRSRSSDSEKASNVSEQENDDYDDEDNKSVVSSSKKSGVSSVSKSASVAKSSNKPR